MLVHFFHFGYPVLIGQKFEKLGWKKSAQIVHPTQKVCNIFRAHYFLFQMGYFKSTIILEHF